MFLFIIVKSIISVYYKISYTVVHKEEIDSNVYIITKGIWRAYHFKYGEEATAWRQTIPPVVRIHDRKRSDLPFQRRAAQAFLLIDNDGQSGTQNAGKLHPALRKLAHGFVETECFRTLHDSFKRISGSHSANSNEIHSFLSRHHSAIIKPHQSLAERNEIKDVSKQKLAIKKQ